MKTRLFFATFFAVIIMISGLAINNTSAQTVSPSKVAYNFNKKVKKSNNSKFSKTGNRRYRNSFTNSNFTTTSVLKNDNGELTIADGKPESSIIELEVGDTKDVALTLNKADKTAGEPKLLADYSKSTTVSVTIDGGYLKITALLPDSFKAADASTSIIEIGGKDMPGIRGIVTVKVKKTVVTELTADPTSWNGDKDNLTGSVQITANASKTLAVRLKAETDNKNVLVSFKDADRMKLSFHAINGMPKDTDLELKIKVTALDGDGKVQSLIIPVKLTADPNGQGNTTTNTNPPATNSGNNTSNQVPAGKTDKQGNQKVTATRSPSPAANINANTAANKPVANTNSNSNVAPKPAATPKVNPTPKSNVAPATKNPLANNSNN